MIILKMICGILLLFLGFVYLYNPRMVMKINFYAKEFLFNDTYILLHRKKIGALFILLAIIAFYMTWSVLLR
ncbi:MAG: hypothetical protein AB1349_03830 [Elusimicrobiota bacterium]